MMAGTVHDVALVFEGGGMRNSYSAGAISVMLEQGLFFDDVYGLSAGATNAIDYVSRDARRNEASFTACLDDLLFRWWVMLFVDADGVGAALHGDARVLSSCALPFDFDAFQANPARATPKAMRPAPRPPRQRPCPVSSATPGTCAPDNPRRAAQTQVYSMTAHPS